MERITGKEVKIMMEALHQVYAQPEEQVEVVSEEVEQLDEQGQTGRAAYAAYQRRQRVEADRRVQAAGGGAAAEAERLAQLKAQNVRPKGPGSQRWRPKSEQELTTQARYDVRQQGKENLKRAAEKGEVTPTGPKPPAAPSTTPPVNRDVIVKANKGGVPGTLNKTTGKWTATGSSSAPAATTPAAKTPPTAPVTTQYQKDRAAIATAKTPEEKAAATKTAETSGMAAWAKANPALAAKVKPGQAGYDIIQKTLNPQKPTAATTATNTATAATALSGKGALSTKPAPAVNTSVAGAKPVATGTPIQGGVKPVAGAPTAPATGTKFGVATPAAATPAAQPVQQKVQTAGTAVGARPTTNQTGTAFSTPGSLAPGANKVMNTPVNQLKKKPVSVEGVDLFDIVKGHLMSEGYADTEEAALAIMANMSEEWRQNILLELTPLGVRAAGAVDDQRRGSTRDKDLKDTADTLRKMRPYPNGFPAVKGV